jgi:hypothetical protein
MRVRRKRKSNVEMIGVYVTLSNQTLSSSKLHKNDFGPRPAALFTNYPSFFGFIFALALDSIDNMLIQTELTVRAGLHSE